MQNDLRDQGWRSRLIRIYLATAVIEGMVALAYLLGIPSDPANAWIFGLSKTRLLMAAILVIGVMVFIGLAIWFWRRPGIITPLRTAVQRGWFYFGILAILLIAGVVFSHLLWLSSVLTDRFIQGWLERLVPIIFWAGILSFQTVFLLPVLRYESKLPELPSQRKIWLVSGCVFVVLIVFWGIVALTGFGITPDAFGWDTPGAPLLSTQIYFAWTIAFVFLIIERFLAGDESKSRRRLLFDLIMSFLIFGVAIQLWSQTPMERAYYAPMPRPPNDELYPYSDAALYDSSAQRLLVGEGFSGITRKPLYVIFLALTHALVGNEYQSVANVQVFVLALLPVFAYWLTKSLHSRFSGVIVALLLIFREKNAITLSEDIRIVHSKVLMSDMPVALGLLLFTWLMVAWLREPAKRRWLPLLVGGIFGLTMLVRSNIVILWSILIVIFVTVFYRRPRQGFFALVLFSIGFGLAIAPWMWRSYRLTGRASFNDPGQVAYHAELYTREVGSLKLPQLPGESEKDYILRLNGHIRDFILDNPDVVAGFVLPHLAHNEISMLLTLPMSPWLLQNPNTVIYNYQVGDWLRLWDECCSVQTYLSTTPFWSGHWTGRISPQIGILLGINLMLVALGLGATWCRWDVVGWIPMGIALTYSLSTALARYSGWRFSLPVDWVGYMYFAIGLGQVGLWGARCFFRSTALVDTFPETPSTRQRIDLIESGFAGLLRHVLITGISVLAIGFSPLIVEGFFDTPQFTDLSQREALGLLQEAGFYEQAPRLEPQEVQNFLENDQAIYLQGRAFYPRFYPAGEGEAGSGWQAYAPRPYSRIGFTLIGTGITQVVMEIDAPPEHLPNASDVFVLGCEADDIVYALAVLVKDETEYFFVTSSDVGLSCPHNLP
ncbi:MAG: hypothetical protein FJ010_09220 [Chloroflexi bacterium]|nr:hypothetical protein [Chloroflexota bacterium]